MKDVMLGLVRHALTAGGGALVAHGVIDAGQAEPAIGALVTLIGIAWSVIEKRQRAIA